ncbi:hypothetical protein DM01DRAFT_1370270 [Hesseltinella vesiculosa]|uniref:HMG box domain-containing protein n=1 Tax=Hesseltinella vesiculosa TaxID=101127 RepID=A0A1X2GWI2_9FUNG|nr:hypothetical protein DM01DRAFT_1370270 [Hesseltinella vesiculosa]
MAPVKIPRPMNCFLLYRNAKQKEILSRCPGANHRDISKIIAKWWKEIGPEEKDIYQRLALQAKAEHRRKYPDYKYSPAKAAKKPQRVYTRHSRTDFFTSRSSARNAYMQRLYHDQDALQGATPALASPGTASLAPADLQPDTPICFEPVTLSSTAIPAVSSSPDQHQLPLVPSLMCDASSFSSLPVPSGMFLDHLSPAYLSDSPSPASSLGLSPLPWSSSAFPCLSPDVMLSSYHPPSLEHIDIKIETVDLPHGDPVFFDTPASLTLPSNPGCWSSDDYDGTMASYVSFPSIDSLPNMDDYACF